MFYISGYFDIKFFKYYFFDLIFVLSADY